MAQYLTDDEVFGTGASTPEAGPTYLSDDEVFGDTADARPEQEVVGDDRGDLWRNRSIFKGKPTAGAGRGSAEDPRRLDREPPPPESRWAQEVRSNLPTIDSNLKLSAPEPQKPAPYKSVLDGVQMTGGGFDAREAERLSQRDYAERAERAALYGRPAEMRATVGATGRQAFTEANPVAAGFAQSAANTIAGTLNAPAVAAGLVNENLVRPVSRAIVGALGGDESLLPGRVGNSPLVDSLKAVGADYTSRLSRKSPGAAWDDGEFGHWLVTQMSGNSFSAAQSLGALFVPGAQASLLASMGAVSAGNAYAEGDSAQASFAKGLVESGSEMLPLKAAEKIKDLVLAIPAPMRQRALAEIGKRSLAAGAAITSNALVGSLEEVVEAVGGNAVDKLISGKDKSLFEDVDRAAIVGAAFGGAMSAPAVGKTLARNTDPAAQALADALNQGQFDPASAATSVDNALRTQPGTSNAISPAATSQAAAMAERARLEQMRAKPTVADIGKAGSVDEAIAVATQAAAAPVAPVTAAPTVDAAIGQAMKAIDPAAPTMPAATRPVQLDEQALLAQAMAGIPASEQATQQATGQAAPAHMAPAAEQPAAQNNQPADQPVKTWFGRRGDGYATPEDASRGLNERRRLQPSLNWNVEQMPDGRYRLAGYAAPATQNGAQAGVTYSGKALGAVPAQNTSTQQGATDVPILARPSESVIWGRRADGRVDPALGQAVEQLALASGRPGAIQLVSRDAALRQLDAGAKARAAQGLPQIAGATDANEVLTGIEQLLGATAQAFGDAPTMVSGLPNAFGVQHNGRAYLDVARLARGDRTGNPLKALFLFNAGHEVTHNLEKSSNPQDRADYAALRAAILGNAKPDRLAARIQDEGQGKTYGENEVVADVSGGFWLDSKFWERLYAIDGGSTMRRIAYKFMESATKLIDAIKGSRLDPARFIENVDEVREVAAQVWARKAQRDGALFAYQSTNKAASDVGAGDNARQTTGARDGQQASGKALAELQGLSADRGGVQRVPERMGGAAQDGAADQYDSDGGRRGSQGGPRFSSDEGLAGDRGGLKPLPGYSVSAKVGSAFGPDPRIAAVAENYAKKNGIPLRRQAEYVKVDPERAARIAAAYDAMPHAPSDPKVKEAFSNLIRQTRAQYDALVDAGYQFTFFDGNSDPYEGNPWAAMRDLRENQRMAVYGTYDGYGTDGITMGATDDNPMLADTGMQWPDQAGVLRAVTANDLFRAVHDAFGHGLEGAGFRADGEENAWQAHVRLFTGSAVAAITSETRGQNSWLNFGPHGQKNQNAAVFDTVFADQKTGLMPEWTWTEGRAGDAVSYSRANIGGFETKTLKDGSLRVFGDVAEIRAMLPEGVVGRAVDGGLMFTRGDAPRVEGALSGDMLGYSRRGKVYDKLPMNSNGEYIGAPPKFNKPGNITKLRKILKDLTLEGAPGRFWYENSSAAVLHMAGGDKMEAKKFVALLAIYSPQAKVDANSTFALRAWAQHKAGQPISVKTGVMDRKATEALGDVEKFWSGEKTGNFYNNLLRMIDGDGDKRGATIDMWMMRAAQYASDAPTDTQYAFMENETNRIAAELGWEPQQVQAAIWVAMKARMENKGVKQRTEAISEKKGWIKFVPSKDGKGKTRVIIDEQKHRDNWLRESMALDVKAEDTNAAKFDFADGVRRNIGQVSWEPRPSTKLAVLPGIHSAPYAQQLEFYQAVQNALLDENGADMLAQKLGLLLDSEVDGPGVWEGEVSAGGQKMVAMAPAAGGKLVFDSETWDRLTEEQAAEIDPNWKKSDRFRLLPSLDQSQKKTLDVYAAVLGLVLRQDGVGYHRPFYAANKADQNGVELRIGRPFSDVEAKRLWSAMDRKMRDIGIPEWENSAAFITSPDGMRVVNFGAVDDNKQFRDLVEKAAGQLPDGLTVDPIYFHSDGNLVGNNWTENRNGESYARAISAYGRPDLLGWSRDVLARRVQAVFDEYSAKYGWGDPGSISFSRADAGANLGAQPGDGDRGQAARREADAGQPEQASRGRDGGVESDNRPAPPPRYGSPREGAVSVVGYHFSKAPRTSLSGAFYGSGLKGDEANRLQGPENADIRPRVFFYVDRGNGVMPEFGVGPHPHHVRLDNLYDATADALGLVRSAKAATPQERVNSWERAIVDAGFDGYVSRDHVMPQHFAVLVGKRHTAVPVATANPKRMDGRANIAPAPSQPKAEATRKIGDELVRLPVGAEVMEIIKAQRAGLDLAAPSFKMQYGEARVLESEAATADAVFEEQGAKFRFGSVSYSWAGMDDVNELGAFDLDAIDPDAFDAKMADVNARAAKLDPVSDEFMAELQRELDEEMGRPAGRAVQLADEVAPSAEAISKAGLLAESAFDFSGNFFERDGKPEFVVPNYIIGMDAVDFKGSEERGFGATVKGGRSAAGAYSSFVSPSQANPLSMDQIKVYVSRQAASYYLHESGHDIANAYRKGTLLKIARVWRDIADLSGAFKLPDTSNSSDFEKVAKDMGAFKGYEVKSTIGSDGFGRVEFKAASGATYYADVSNWGDGALQCCTMGLAGGGGLGSEFYAVLAVVAKNMGKRFVADDFLSGINSYRRTEQAFSYAIKTGDTGVLLPGGQNRVYGYNTRPKTQEDHAKNIARLALAGMRNVQEIFPDVRRYSYDAQADVFTDSRGRNADAVIDRLLKEPEARAFGLGRSTVARAVLTSQIIKGDLDVRAIKRIAKPVAYSMADAELDKPIGEGWGDHGAGVDGLNPNLRRFMLGSKVVDKDGMPLVVYHKTDADITEFDLDRIGKNDYGYAGRGFYFMPIPLGGLTYGNTTMPVYLSLKNPYMRTDTNWKSTDDPYQWIPANKDRFPNIAEASKAWTEMMLSRGFDGFMDKTGNGDGEIVAFRPNQIKSVFNHGAYNPNDNHISYSKADISPLGYYSALTRGIDGLKSSAAPAAGWKDAIKGLVNKGQAKADEVEWSGLNDWLDTRQGRVTKDEVLEYLRGNGVQVQEVVLGNPNGFTQDMQERLDDLEYRIASLTDEEESERQRLISAENRASDEWGDTNQTKYGSYTLPGGENYREVLITLPDEPLIDRRLKAIAEEIGDQATSDERVAELRAERDDLERQLGRKELYKSSHWDQLNILAHIRVNDRVDADGKRVLFVEELQSDFQQDYRKSKAAIKSAVESDFEAIVSRMKKAGVLEVVCD